MRPENKKKTQHMDNKLNDFSTSYALAKFTDMARKSDSATLINIF